MRIPPRILIIFGGMVFIAAYGVGQVWSLALSLREGTGGLAAIATGILGALLLVISAIAIGRILYVLRNTSASTADLDPIKDEAEDD